MPEQTNGKLVSWKEIAAYLRCDVRTVQRWELELGLPVRRPPGAKGHRVFAFPAEIDAWLTQHGNRRDVAGRGDTATIPTSTTTSVTSPESITLHKRRRVFGGLVAGIVLVALVGAIIWWERRDLEIGGVTFAGQQVLAWSQGKVVWSYDFGQPVDDLGRHDVTLQFRPIDLKGGSRKGVLVAPPLFWFDRGDLSTDAIYCFSSRGKLLWRRIFDDKLRFGDEDTGPRWETSALLVTQDGATPAIWCAISSFPTSASVLFRLDNEGHVTRHFVNFGHVRALNEVRTPAGSFVLAGGINNEYNCAMLAVLKEPTPAGRSPQTGTRADCDGCPTNEPYRYVLFPPSEVCQASGEPYNGVHTILVNGTRVQAISTESDNPDELKGAVPNDWAMYSFSEDFAPVSVVMSDNYWAHHRQLEAEGKLKHDVEHCPERLKPITVRVWSSRDGWKDVKLPPVAAKPKA